MNRQTDQELLHDFARRNSEAAFSAIERRHADLVYVAPLLFDWEMHNR